jgi:hypothetical protein
VAVEQDAELVAAEAVGASVAGDRRLKIAGETAQERVARGVTEGVVVLLEAVEVEERERARLVRRRRPRGVIEVEHQGPAVRQPGEAVGQRFAPAGLQQAQVLAEEQHPARADDQQCGDRQQRRGAGGVARAAANDRRPAGGMAEPDHAVGSAVRSADGCPGAAGALGVAETPVAPVQVMGGHGGGAAPALGGVVVQVGPGMGLASADLGLAARAAVAPAAELAAAKTWALQRHRRAGYERDRPAWPPARFVGHPLVDGRAPTPPRLAVRTGCGAPRVATGGRPRAVCGTRGRSTRR